MKNWDYANLAREAKEHGGPQKFVGDVYEDGRYDGRVEGGIIGVIGILGLMVLKKAYQKAKEEYEKHKAKVEADKTVAVQSIEAEITYTQDEFNKDSFNSAVSTDNITTG